MISYRKILPCKTYKKVAPDVTNPIDLEAKCIAKKLQLDDRVNTTAKREAFITLKDHKPNFAKNPTCRLINPAKSEIGKVSKQILDRINTSIVSKLGLNQWKNTKAVLNWFNSIENKDDHSFIAFDVVEFYPSISDCLKQSVVYQATVSTNDGRPDQTYVGLTEKSFKTRFANHKASFSTPSKNHSTELSKHIWQMKDTKTDFKVSWKILKQAKPYNPASNCCNLCLWEKYFIICRPDLGTLNKQNELITSCRHASKFLLKNAKVVTR